MGDLSVILLHDGMVDKHNKAITASLTLIDIHDFARSSCTYGVKNVFVAHSSPVIRKLARALQSHWEEGFGSTYNPNRKEAIEAVEVVSDLDEAIRMIDTRTGKLPTLVATSARPSPNRYTFASLREQLSTSDQPHLLMFGTGWGMGDPLLKRADYFLEPINGPTEYNHLSVRSACAIMLDRVLGR